MVAMMMGKHLTIGGYCLATAVAPVSSFEVWGGGRGKTRAVLVYHQMGSSALQKSPLVHQRSSATSAVILHAAGDDGGGGEWDISDDWSQLSSATSAPDFSSLDGSHPMSFDSPTDEAARILEEHERIVGEWDSSGAEDDDGDEGSGGGGGAKDEQYVKTSGDGDLVEDAVEIIATHADYDEPDGVQLYDTVSSTKEKAKVANNGGGLLDKNGENEDEELAFMIRCNQSPEQFLISQGKAVPELTDEAKYSPNFLLEERALDEIAAKDLEGSTLLPFQPKMTPYFEKAVTKIFDTYASQVEVEHSCAFTQEAGKMQMKAMDRDALSKWMTTCLSSPLSSSESDGGGDMVRRRTAGSTGSMHIGPYDTSVSATLSRYASHGSGRLSLQDFQAMYLECTWRGYINDIISRKIFLNQKEGDEYQIPSANVGVLIEGKKNTEKMLNEASLSFVWRDLEAHEIFSPAEQERVQMLLEMERLKATFATTDSNNSELLVDECELFEEYEDRLSHQTYSDENENDIVGVDRSSWDKLQKREKSSHEFVEMASDGENPLRIRDGQFVAIDEETCIGCTQV